MTGSAPQAPPSGRGLGAPWIGPYSLPGSPALWAGSFTSSPVFLGHRHDRHNLRARPTCGPQAISLLCFWRVVKLLVEVSVAPVRFFAEQSAPRPLSHSPSLIPKRQSVRSRRLFLPIRQKRLRVAEASSPPGCCFLIRKTWPFERQEHLQRQPHRPLSKAIPSETLAASGTDPSSRKTRSRSIA